MWTMDIAIIYLAKWFTNYKARVLSEISENISIFKWTMDDPLFCNCTDRKVLNFKKIAGVEPQLKG